MTLKSDAKFKESLTCGFNYDTRNLVTFHSTTQKSESFTSIGSFCSKYRRFDLKKHWGVIFHDTQHLCKIWIKPNLMVSIKLHEELGEISLEHSKVWKYIDGFFLSKTCNASARKFQRNYVSRQWRVMHSWENWLAAWKMT